MTPFMVRVAELVGGPDDAVDISELPMVRPSRPERVNRGTDRQVALRSVAEQLVSEANAVLPGPDDHLALTDEIHPDELAFRLDYRGRAARVSTRFADGRAYGRIVGDDVPATGEQELIGTDALPDLIVRLLVTAGVPHHPTHD